MSPQTVVETTANQFTRAERQAMRALRARYQQDHGLFGARELAHLSFLRWLYQTGHFTGTVGGSPRPA
jgi:hypothetical protein